MLHYYDLKRPGNSMDITPAVPEPSTSAGLLAPATQPVSISKVASDTLPAVVPTPSLPGTPSVSGTQLPFSATLAGRHIKFELPKPSKFSHIAADSDILAWLLRIQEYLSVTGVEQSVWVVFASNYLDKAPLQLWEARKSQLAQQPDVLYSWDSFREWCISSFSVHNHERHALTQLENLRQTGSVAEYMAAHNVLASQTSLPMQLRIHWWEKGLKEHIRSQVTSDPVTYKEFTDISKAQSAALALDAHLNSSSAAAARKHSRPVSASARTERPRSQRFKFSDLTGKPPRDVKIAKWNNDNPEGFTCDMEGRLADPLPQFFQSWIAEQPTSIAEA